MGEMPNYNTQMHEWATLIFCTEISMQRGGRKKEKEETRSK